MMVIRSMTFGILFLIQGVSAKYYCEESWRTNPSNGFCYKLFPDLQTWKQARSSCTQHGGFLALVTDENEQQFILKDVLQNYETSSVWIGGHSLYSDGWVWDNYQRKFNFTQWAAGEPVSTSRCIAMLGASGFKWSDQSCADSNLFICEKQAQVVYCDGKPNTVHLEANKLTSISFPPFYDPRKPFQLPPYEKNLTCVWTITPPMGYRIVMEFDLHCNDAMRALSGFGSLDTTCQMTSGNAVVESPLTLIFTSDSFSRSLHEQGFQFRLFATNAKESSCDPTGTVMVASSQKQSIIFPGFPSQRFSSCVWTIMSPVKASNIYVQFKYLNISEGAQLEIQNDVFTGTSILEEGRVLIYSAERIIINYNNLAGYPGHYGFLLDYFTDDESVEMCTQNLVPRTLSEYGIPNPKEQFIIFSVNSTHNIEVDLHTVSGEKYSITANQEHSGYSYCLRKTSTSSCAETYNNAISRDEFQDLWVTWTDTLKVGRGRILGEHVIMEYRIYNPLNVTSISIQTENDTGDWKFYGFQTDFVDVCHTSGTPLKSLWDYHLPVQGQNHLNFSVMNCDTALITFQTQTGNIYRILIEFGFSICITIRTNEVEDSSCIYDVDCNSYCSKFCDFWISWENSASLQIGRGKFIGTDTIISSNYTIFYPIKEHSFKFGSNRTDSRYMASVWRFNKAAPGNITILRSEVVLSQQEIEGTELTMSVDINLRFGFEVKWFRNGIHVTRSSGRFLIHQKFTDVMRCSLTITELNLQDEGNWTVVISNQHSKAAWHFDIKVEPGIQIDIIPRHHITVPTGVALELICEITNLDDLQGYTVNISSLIWFKDGIRLQEGGRISMTTNQSFRLLNIHPTEESDEGTYYCIHEKYKVARVANTTVDIYTIVPVVCPSEKDAFGILWPTSISGSLVFSDCPNAQQGNASRFCDDYGTWRKTCVSYCTDKGFSNVLNEVQALENDSISNKYYIEQTFESSLQRLENLTASKHVISLGNLLSSMDIINTVLKVATQSNAFVPEKNVYGILDNIASANNKDSWKLAQEEVCHSAFQRNSGPSLLLDIMDRTNSLLMKDTRPIEYRGENIVVNISEISLNESGIQFLENDSFIVLPRQQGQQQQATKYSAVLYKTMSQFLSTTSNIYGHWVINSMVMSLALEPPLNNLSPPLELVFEHNEGVRVEGEAECVFWDYTLFNDGGWSTKGCSLNYTQNGTSVCFCNHTTNFAILMRPYTPPKEESALVIISIVGCVISMLFGLLTICVYVIFWKFIKSDQNFLIICLCASLFLAYLLLLAGIDNSQNEAACVVVTALLHYLLLITFFMMFGVGIIFFMNVTVLFYAMHITNNFNSQSRLKWILGFATCIPLIIVLITLGSCWNTKYHSDAFCWLAVSSGAIYAFVVPVLIIFLLSICIIVSLARVMHLTTKMKKVEFKEEARYALISVCSLVPVLGVTWGFGIVAINEDALAFQCIFTILNSMQGLLMFITHVLLNTKIRKLLIARYRSLNPKRERNNYKEKDHVRAPSTISENVSSKTQSLAFVPSNYTEFEIKSRDPDESQVIERHHYVTKLELWFASGRYTYETETSSSSIAFDEKIGKEEDDRGIIEGEITLHSGKKSHRKMHKPREIGSRHTDTDTSRVATSNIYQC